MKRTKETWFVYILRCAGNRLYTGITNNLKRRFALHLSGKGARFTKAFKPSGILYNEKYRTKSLALKREAAIKRLPKPEKTALIFRNHGHNNRKRSRIRKQEF